MQAVKDISKLLADVPKGAWVALSKDQERVIAYAAELEEALRKAKEAGEDDPIITRVPEVETATLIFFEGPFFSVPSVPLPLCSLC